LIQINALADSKFETSRLAAALMPSIINIRTRGRMSAAGDDTHGRPRRRRMEILAFLFLTAVLMPALAVAAVGSYGLAVWVYQMAAGPPGPPTR
jgi:periplasmic nitrate reductase NapE